VAARIFFLLLFTVLIGFSANSQPFLHISGHVTDTTGKPVARATVKINTTGLGTISDDDGFFELPVITGDSVTIVISSVGYRPVERVVRYQGKTDVFIEQTVVPDISILDVVTVRAETDRPTTMTRIEGRVLDLLPSASGSIEQVLKTLPGVSSQQELSSQYSVRGGSYDENLLFVNDVEIYRPFLISSGQQEGMSFINPDMVSSLRFSSGGFDASYGDKMSSVLDITYKKPAGNCGSASVSMLGGTAHIEGLSANKKITYISGFRYHTTQYLLSTLETRGEYIPRFLDFQTYMTFELTKRTELSFLGNIAQNRYDYYPDSLVKAFGTFNNVLNLRIYYEGSEADKYNTWLGCFGLNHKPNKKTSLKFICSGFTAAESETYDIEGAYLLQEAEDQQNPSATDSAMNIGIGAFHNHARNFLDVYVFSLRHKGSFAQGDNKLQWGMGAQREIVFDELHEWEMIDSAGYSIPYSNNEVNLARSAISSNTLYSTRMHLYAMNTHEFSTRYGTTTLNAGARFSYWDFNQALNAGPRMTLAFEPEWKRDFLFRLSGGIYHQPPFFREMRSNAGIVNRDIKSQQAIHVVMGSDYNFYAWERPFKFTAEAFYKWLSNLIPYKLENVRIRYAGDNMADGYAMGVDFKVNGEFVKGTESWISLSLLRSREDVRNDSYVNGDGLTVYPGYYPRPTDQFATFGMYFQDYLPRNPSLRMNLTFLYGTGYPFTSPYTERYDLYWRMPAYKRVDLGLSKILINENSVIHDGSIFKPFKGLVAGVEVFNLFNIKNRISHIWVRTLSDSEYIPDMYAVPVFLTGRRLNVKLTVRF